MFNNPYLAHVLQQKKNQAFLKLNQSSNSSDEDDLLKQLKVESEQEFMACLDTGKLRKSSRMFWKDVVTNLNISDRTNETQSVREGIEMYGRVQIG